MTGFVIVQSPSGMTTPNEVGNTVQVPMACVLTLVNHDGLLGIWHALIAGYAAIAVLALLPVLFCTNWERLAALAQARAAAKQKHQALLVEGGGEAEVATTEQAGSPFRERRREGG